jgi:hypothetical protein
MPTTKAKPVPGPKPAFLVVEDHLKVQTNEGEKSFDLRIPFKKLELFMDMEGIEQKLIPRHMLDNILWPEDKATIEEMRDGAKAFEILFKIAELIGDRMGANMGESVGSSEPSEPTDEPSDSTSDATSDSDSTTS